MPYIIPAQHKHLFFTLQIAPMNKTFTTILSILFVTLTMSLHAQPKREFRAAWVATVTNIDWPSSKSLSSSSQKSEALAILDKHKLNNINAIILQIRPSCDALYPSNYEPWSEYLVGVQGGNLSVYYDPLQFWIDEAHKRGMELHAWFNPYRSVVSSGSSVHSTHISKTKPEWNITYGASPYKFLDPGIPDVQKYVVNVIMDVVRRYNIDGVHFDDYFYPYGGMTNQDSATYANYKGSFNNIGDWRRNNVNTLIAMVHDSIKSVKSWVKFGMSPFGIWRPNNPVGITGMDAYTQIYCDPLNWLTNKKVDYLTPQTYWVIGGPQDYSKLMPWWGQQTAANGRHLYTGNAAYRLAASSSNWPATEIQNQIELNRIQNRAQGMVFFSSKSITGNLKGIQDSLRANQFRTKAIPPTMPWLDNTPPVSPASLNASVIGDSIRLEWQSGAIAQDGDTTVRFAVYSAINTPTEINLTDPKNMRFLGMCGETSFTESPAPPSSLQYAAVVTAFDKVWNESGSEKRIYLAPAGKPFMIVENQSLILDDVALGQTATGNVSVYNRAGNTLEITSLISSVQGLTATISSSTILDSAILNITYTPSLLGHVYDSVFIVNNSMLGTVKIAVRGNSPIPTLTAISPTLLYSNTSIGDSSVKYMYFTTSSMNDVRIDSFKIASSNGVYTPRPDSLPVIISVGDTLSVAVSFTPDTAKFFIDTIIVHSTAQNSPTKIVLFGNGQIQLSADRESGMWPLAYGLSQNYPNPFNPQTTLSFTLVQSHHTTLKVYDLLGRELATVVDGILDGGTHTYTFDGSTLASGVYVYRLVSGTFVQTKKMVLQK
jgi:uncharacterized lipoprotein YddW (UPF0748 family)